MQKFKKALIVFVLILSIACLLVACGDENVDNEGDQNLTDNVVDTPGDTSNDTNSDTNTEDNNTNNNGGDASSVIKPPVMNSNLFVFEPIAGTKTCVLKNASLVNSLVEIPASSNNLTVVGIAPNAFRTSIMVKEVTIPDSVEEIGDFAFSGCVNLEKVNFSQSSQLKRIGENAFFNCDKLHTVTLPTELNEVGDKAFSGCIDLINLTFPEALTKVGAEAFHAGWFDAIDQTGIVYVGKVAYAYINLEEERVPQDITLSSDTIAIASKAFYGNPWVKSVTIPKSVNYVGALALNNASALETITVDTENTTYSSDGNALIERASATLLSSTPTTEVPAYVEVIGEEAYAYSSATFISIPNSVTRIMKGAFKYSSVTEVNIPFNVTVIEEDTFLNCISLRTITIHSKITDIKEASFNFTNSLATVIIENQAIYDKLDTPYAFSGLIAHAETVYVKEGIEGQADQLIVGYDSVTTDKVGYKKFVKKENN